MEELLTQYGLSGIILFAIGVFIWRGLWPFLTKEWWEFRKTQFSRELEAQEQQSDAMVNIARISESMSIILNDMRKSLLEPMHISILGMTAQLDVLAKANPAVLLGVITFDMEGKVTHVDTNTAKIFSCHHQDMLGKAIGQGRYVAINTDGFEFSSGNFPVLRSIEKREMVHPKLMGIRHPVDNDEMVWVALGSRPIFDGEEQIGALAVVAGIGHLMEDMEAKLVLKRPMPL